MSAAAEGGSSPLARGTPGGGGSGVRLRRFIPARAGNTPIPVVMAVWISVHPRSRGEHNGGRSGVRTRTGSSPLARGTRPPGRILRPRHRFIPARAGNTPACATGGPRSPVHPRSRGEHPPVGDVGPALVGSSPLARGTPTRRLPPPARDRFIPARAGNTSAEYCRQSGVPVHPRSRGEHGRGTRRRATCRGSSPLARGTPARAGGAAGAGRFIPARAGNTPARDQRVEDRSVHPRSRGEHSPVAPRAEDLIGSSPLARGTRPGTSAAGRHRRFIPARAGNTTGSGSSSSDRTVHPRSRGEHRRAVIELAQSLGSSPLARGTRHGRVRPPGRIRFIPARAGNTRTSPSHE